MWCPTIIDEKRKHMKFIFSGIIISILLLNIGCEKDDCSKKRLNEDKFLSYWFFDSGSYWVYKVDGAEIYDTVTIEYGEIHEDTELSPQEIYHTKGRYYKTYLLHSNNDIYGYYYGAYTEYKLGGYRPEHDDWLMTQNFKGLTGGTSGKPFVNSNFSTFNYPYTVGENIFQTSHIDDVITLTVPAGTFENTVHVKPHIYWYYSGADTYYTDLYLSPGIGTTKIIMSRYTDTITWSLIDFYAPKYCSTKYK